MSRTYSLVISLVLATACVNAEDRFNEFEDRVIDANGERIDAPSIGEIPDISGEFLLGLDPRPVAPGSILQFSTTVTFAAQADGTATIDLSIQPLTVQGRTPVGDPLLSNGVTVNTAGEFSAPVNGTVAGAANPISGQDITFDISLDGIVRSADLFCGVVAGDVTAPLQLNVTGSTFGAIRIAPGTVGDALPEPVVECPPDMPDAGVPDAGVPDAGAADAGMADAA